MNSLLPDLDYNILAAGVIEADVMIREASIEVETDENKRDLKKVAQSLTAKGHFKEVQVLESIIDSM